MTRMRDKDQIKRKSTQPFYTVYFLSLEKLIQLSNPKPELDFYHAYRILTSNLQFPPWE